MGRGRKSKYTPERVEIITKAIADGKTYKEAYTMAGIGKDAFYDWINDKPEFAEAVKRAEAIYNEWYNTTLVQDCKRSLRDLVLGYDYTETRTESTTAKDGKTKVTKTTTTVKHVAPNPTAIIFALTNRDPENWKNRQTNEITGNLKTESETKVDLSNVPDSVLDELAGYLDGGKEE